MSRNQAKARIDLDAIEHNFNHIRGCAPASRIMAIIKADAYGHGAIEVARKLGNADALGVARLSEAVKLREAGIHTPICLLEGIATREELNLASIYEFIVVVHDDSQLELLDKGGARRPVWLKVDTGMGRLGFPVEQVPDIVSRLRHQKLQGFMTHLANASDPDSAYTEKQIGRIQSISRKLQTDHPAATTLSIANSAGIMMHPTSHADWVRPGIMLYGATPMDNLEPVMALHPAMTLTAPIIAIKKIKAGESVGYGSLWTAASDAHIAVIAIGYGDGYPRETAAGTPVLIGGHRRRLVGRVSMDMICVELEPEDAFEVGERAVLWGEGLPVEEIARAAGTITYTLLTGVTQRVTREYRGKLVQGKNG